jgi:chromosome partitioning protein
VLIANPLSVLRPSRPALVTSLCNQKGGVGKTTTTINLSRAASLVGLAVLVVDLDPQGNTTSALAPAELAKDAIGVADALIPDAEYTMNQVIVPTIWEGVKLAPTPNTEALSEAESRLGAMRFGREKRLDQVLKPLRETYDLILIDNTPSLGLLLLNSLTASEFGLVVTQPEQWSADGLAELEKTIDLVIQYHNPQLRRLGPLINGKRRSAHHDRIVAKIVEFYGGDAWAEATEIIPLRSGISDHVLAGLGLDQGKEAWMWVVATAYRTFIERMLRAGGRL